jgi:hypothetical protein
MLVYGQGFRGVEGTEELLGFQVRGASVVRPCRTVAQYRVWTKLIKLGLIVKSKILARYGGL